MSDRIRITLVALSFALVLVGLMVGAAVARDDGRYAASPLKSWFDSLVSRKGPCCSDADGTALSDVDWEVRDGQYRVRIDGEWYDVPEAAVLMQPNLYGKTMVWPVMYRGMGTLHVDIRCFIPGSMT